MSMRSQRRAGSVTKRRYLPCLEVLEDRRLPAQVLFGGIVLKETFDDAAQLQFTSSPSFGLDDFGADPTDASAVNHVVFHHAFSSSDITAYLVNDGTTSF